MVFIVCLYNWDYTCDTDFIENILAVYDTLQAAVEFTRSYVFKRKDHCIEIEEIVFSNKLGSYDKDGNKV